MHKDLERFVRENCERFDAVRQQGEMASPRCGDETLGGCEELEKLVGVLRLDSTFAAGDSGRNEASSHRFGVARLLPRVPVAVLGFTIVAPLGKLRG